MNDHERDGHASHFDARFDEELDELKQHVVEMGQLVERQARLATGAFMTHDSELAQRVIQGDGAVNAMELASDERCVRLLALHQPAATDLRFIAAVLKIVTDLERIGDLAVSIARHVAALQPPKQPAADELPRLLDAALGTLHEALAAFVNRDAERAEATRTQEEPIKTGVEELSREIVRSIRREPRGLESALATLVVAKHVERIAAHATNVAEMAVYTTRGEDVRHSRPRR